MNFFQVIYNFSFEFFLLIKKLLKIILLNDDFRELLKVLISWPLVVLLIAVFYRKPLKNLIENISMISIKNWLTIQIKQTEKELGKKEDSIRSIDELLDMDIDKSINKLEEYLGNEQKK